MALVRQELGCEDGQFVIGCRHRAALAVRQNHRCTVLDADDAVDLATVHNTVETGAVGIGQRRDRGRNLLAVTVDVNEDRAGDGQLLGTTTVAMSILLHWCFSCLIFEWAVAREHRLT